MTYGPCSQFIGNQPKVSAPCNGYVVAEEPKRRRRKLTKLPSTFQPFNIRETWCVRDTVVVVHDRKYTGVVFKSFFTQDFKSPQGVGCNRIARRAEADYRRPRDILDDSPRSPHVVAKLNLCALINHPMRVSVASDTVPSLTNRLN